MREITSHKTNECNEAIAITADDRDEKYGNASHDYEVRYVAHHGGVLAKNILFQRGPIKEVGVNGLTNEVLLAILIDRMEGFQSGPFACGENAIALEYMRCAMDQLKKRTAKRVERGRSSRLRRARLAWPSRASSLAT